MELFLMFICYVLGAVIGYEVVKFLRVLWFFHKLGKAKKALDEALSELDEGTLEKAFNAVGKSMYNLGASIQKSLDDKEEK